MGEDAVIPTGKLMFLYKKKKKLNYNILIRHFGMDLNTDKFTNGEVLGKTNAEAILKKTGDIETGKQMPIY